MFDVPIPTLAPVELAVDPDPVIAPAVEEDAEALILDGFGFVDVVVAVAPRLE